MVSDCKSLLYEENLSDWADFLVTCLKGVPCEISVSVPMEEFIFLRAGTSAQCGNDTEIVQVPMSGAHGVKGWIWTCNEA